MFSGISINVLRQIAAADGVMYQLPLFYTPPKFEIKEEYLTSVFSGIKCVDDGANSYYGSTSSVDHPAFTALRNHLEAKGYIKTERSYSNGDVVLSGFFLNDIYFPRGSRFVCAPAMKGTLKFGPITYEEECKYLDIRVPYNETKY